MNRTTDDELINQYLEALRAESAVLAPNQRAVLLSQLENHLEEARADGVDIRTSIDQLGRPEEVVREALGEDAPVPTAPSNSRLITALWAVGLVLSVLWSVASVAVLIWSAVAGASQGWLLIAAGVVLVGGVILSFWTARNVRQRLQR